MKTLIVTGGTGGLGTEVVRRLESDYRCIVLTRQMADLSHEASVSDAIAKAAQSFGPLYGLVHIAGGFAPGKLADTSGETWAQMLAVNTTAAFYAIRETLAHLRRGEPGRIVAVSSIASVQKRAGSAAYTVSKSALNTLIEVTAAELHGTGITVNAVLPDGLATPAMRAVSRESDKLVPLENVADTIAFLLSERAASVTGALIPLRT